MASTCSSFWRAAETHRKPRLPALAKGAEKPYQRGLPAPYPAGSERGRSSGVEHDLAKVGVEGSNPFARSNFSSGLFSPFAAVGRRGRQKRNVNLSSHFPSFPKDSTRSAWVPDREPDNPLMNARSST